MKNKVLRKQYVCNDCFVCGTLNQAGLKAKFYEMENGDLVGAFTAQDMHQSYPNRLHGGVSAAMVDEAMGRSIMILEPATWGVTAEMETKYLKPVPLNEELLVVAKTTRNTRFIFETEGKLLLKDGTVAVTAHGKYVKMAVKKIDASITDVDEVMYYEDDKGPQYIEY